MRFTLNITMLEPDQYIPLAQAAEAAGFYAASVSDSIFYPKDVIGEYPYHKGREFLDGKPFIEPFVAIGAMAASTKTLRFSTYVLKMAIREPLVLAKSVLSAAVMSGGRLTMGVGLSPWLDDFTYCQVPWEGRGERMDEMIAILRGLQSGEYFEFHGNHFDFPLLKMCPAPEKPVPITIGGHTPPALRRAAKLGDGWASANLKRAEMKGLISQLNAFRQEYGTDKRSDYIVQGMLTDIDTFSLDGYREGEEMGMTDIVLIPWGVYQMKPMTLTERVDAIKRFGDEVISRF
jgi:alkanesulfonate monooxygenase SsuD/methylene tetrahydromethanopterin reductase-like flavin-dependent oxidoreductase (luciferase family)